jgi:tetratricopeptide (TPR) repeat protein
MRDSLVRAAGLAGTVLYGAAIVWMYSAQPQTVAEVTGGLTSTIGAYRIDQQAFQDGVAFFKRDQFDEARAALSRADPAVRDAQTQFYIAYTYYRQGWGRLYSDDVLFKTGLEAIERAIALAPEHRLVVDDPDVGIHTADELRAELQRGLTTEASDFNPLRLVRPRR